MDAAQQIRRMDAGRGLGHAYLIEGEASPPRRALAQALAQALVCTGADKPCTVCPHCKKVEMGIHPDVIALAPEPGKELPVGKIRAMRGDAYIRPNEAARKVYWISDANRMNQAAQNALLKVLEEGPHYVAFLLEAPSGALLLPTIASRCEGLRALPDAAHTPEEGEHAHEAARLAQALLGGDAVALAEYCVTLEKRKREELMAILDGAAARLTHAPPGRALPCILALRRCRAACERNVGTGHIAGYLAAHYR